MQTEADIDAAWTGIMLTYTEQDHPGAPPYQRTIPGWQCKRCGQKYGTSGRPPSRCECGAGPIHSGTNPTPYEAEGRCWRCGGKDERDVLTRNGRRPRRPVCCSCVWTLVKAALVEEE